MWASCLRYKVNSKETLEEKPEVGKAGEGGEEGSEMNAGKFVDFMGALVSHASARSIPIPSH